MSEVSQVETGRNDNMIDVRTIIPRERHPLIFQRLAELNAGEVLRLVNDHNPKPLRYQLEAEYPGQFRWDVVEDGPEQWQIDIVSQAYVVDARPIIEAGEEPFATIMESAEKVKPGEVLVVWAPFEPVPLEGVLAEQGFRHVAEEVDPGNWRVTFLKDQ